MGKKRILLIDDEAVFTQLAKMNLEQTGRYEVQVENSGASGLATARAFQPHLIFLDIVMPDMDGHVLADQIRQDAGLKTAPIVYLTAMVSKGEQHPHRGALGNHPLLAKPVNTEEMVACIERFTK